MSSFWFSHETRLLSLAVLPLWQVHGEGPTARFAISTIPSTLPAAATDAAAGIYNPASVLPSTSSRQSSEARACATAGHRCGVCFRCFTHRVQLTPRPATLHSTAWPVIPTRFPRTLTALCTPEHRPNSLSLPQERRGSLCRKKPVEERVCGASDFSSSSGSTLRGSG